MKKTVILLAAILTAVATVQAQSSYRSDANVKNKKGATVMGVVESAGKPVSGVVVSDGYETTVTDKNGRYWLPSRKVNGQVFISTPSGYVAASTDVVPGFWADLTEAPAVPERHDFLLEKVDDQRHAMIVIADPHFANTHDDAATFNRSCLPTIAAVADELTADGVKVYTICLGDASWDRFWYDNDFKIGDFRKLLNDMDYPTPLYNVMGNHDNDGSVAASDSTDFLAAKPYMKAFGPRYYSFNVGGVHYVVMDDIVYLNEGKPRMGNGGIAGSCNYDKYFTPEQLEWLEKDLSYVTDKSTPVMIAAHIPIYRSKSRLGKEYVPNLNEGSSEALLAKVAGFDNVHFLTGHTHYNMLNRIPAENNVIEHNIAGTCGAWWNTSSIGNKVYCPDGRPAGFALFTNDGKDVKWTFKAFESDKQFCVYDINSVRDYYANSGELKVFLKRYPEWSDFSEGPDNQVYIDVWAWDPEWTVKVTENGRELPLEHLSLESPLYNNAYMVPKTVWVENYPKSYDKPRRVPMFRVVASAPDTPLEVTVTDTFGNVYTERIDRPVKFERTDW